MKTYHKQGEPQSQTQPRTCHTFYLARSLALHSTSEMQLLRFCLILFRLMISPVRPKNPVPVLAWQQIHLVSLEQPCPHFLPSSPKLNNCQYVLPSRRPAYQPTSQPPQPLQARTLPTTQPSFNLPSYRPNSCEFLSPFHIMIYDHLDFLICSCMIS